MRKRLTACALLLILILNTLGCGGKPTPVGPGAPARGEATGNASGDASGEPEMRATLLVATPTLDLVTPEQIGRQFFEAWDAAGAAFDPDPAAESGAYAEMYGLLPPSQREALTFEDFQAAYRTALETTTAISKTVTPQMLNIDGARAWIEFREVWHTTLFGDLRANNSLDLVLEGDQWWVDWDRAAIWPDLKEGQRFAVEYMIPPRANIYDYQGSGLAVPATIVTVGVVPGQIEDETLVLDTLSKVLGMTYEQIQGRYQGQPADWFVAIGDISGDESLAWDTALTLPGIARRDRTGRLYPLDGAGAGAIGWISPVPAETWRDYRRRGYRGDERVGIAGLEAWGEEILSGRNGARLYLVAEDGTYLGGVAERQPERGRAIYATLDRELQHAAEVALGDRRGAVVALDVKTGAIRTLASGPHFDSNIFVRPTDDWRRQAVLYDSRQPLINRALQGQYPAGSVFKIVTLAAALGPGSMAPESPFSCPGYWDGLGVANRKMCWLESGHGDISLQEGLTASCNVVFYEVGTRLHQNDPATLSTFGTAFGFGQLTGFEELPEAVGLMPGPKWKFATYRESWATGDTVNLAIGQGFLLVTPLQVARMVAAVANGGTLHKPYLVDRIEGNAVAPEQVTAPETGAYLPVSDAHLAIIQAAMRGVTTDPEIGTATHRFRGLPIAVAGKTGTAEAGEDEVDPHAWFAGYFPADNPEIAMVVMVEHGGEGSTIAAPIFRQIIEGYYGLEITPLPEATPASP